MSVAALSPNTRYRALIRPLFAETVAVEVCDPQGTPPAPFMEEAACLSPNAVEKRRREFAAGRAAAHHAMETLGLSACAIPVGPKRAPVWPTGVVGSISHCHSIAVAVVAHPQDMHGLGVDVEEDVPLSENLIPQICRPAERDWLSRQDNPGQLAKVIFSAKEAAYKCQYRLSECFFGFDGMELDMELAQTPERTSGRFSARFTADQLPFCRGDTIEGCFVIGEGLIATAAQLPQVR
ncbi:4'-phosphopantetheinyl transferase family protein [Phaeobacter porticola]|uniref:Enterobactin synthase component D n=1 Tax=Phaeobacter porticola TaxID=1844006 RepID=A0A1L3I7Q2_9RHOB|nr:4'-phosphopantetheinyl transferase superfamily protein [Phaeobacter porticola]APG48199.1 4'-phosphopantetheinyl transferase-like protein [Phaeobacter porticola]